MITRIREYAKIHRIETFGLLLALVLVVLLLDVVHVHVAAAAEDRDFLGSNAIYTSEVSTSLSGLNGTVEGVYGDKNHTKIAVVVHFLDTTNMVLDAKSYQLFVTGFNVTRGINVKPQITNLSGGYYLFPSTGYAVIYLTNADGFPSQALECVVRCNESLTNIQGRESAELKQRSASYSAYDQYRVVINPAATGVEYATFVENFDPAALYQYVVIDTREAKIRRQLMQDTIDINNSLKRIQTDMVALEGNSVEVPQLQDEIIYDSVEKIDPATVLVPPKDPDDATDATDYTGFDLKFIPNMILPGGVDFPWANFDLHSGVSFIDALNTSGDSAMTYLAGLKAESNKVGNLVWPVDFSSTQVRMLDGSILDLTQSFANTENIKATVETYRNDVTTYYELKKNYQTKHLVEYLELEYEATETGKSYSSNSGVDKGVVLY